VEDAAVVKLEVGESIGGILLEKRASEIFGFIYKIKMKDRVLPQIVCGTTILNRKMQNKSEGDEVLIERVADVKTSKGRFAHNYETYHREKTDGG
jgi:hypothetical protein